MGYKSLTYMFLALVVVFLSSCAALSAAKTVLGVSNDIPNVNLKAQVGKSNVVNEGLINNDTGDRIDVDDVGVLDKSERRTGNNNDNSTTNIPWWVYVVGMVAALFVRPVEVYKRIRGK